MFPEPTYDGLVVVRRCRHNGKLGHRCGIGWLDPFLTECYLICAPVAGLFANRSSLSFVQQRKEQVAQASIVESAQRRYGALARADEPAPNGASRTRVNILGGREFFP